MPIADFFVGSTLATAFDDLQRELVGLDRAWSDARERASLRHAAADLRHHVCAALTWLDDLDACHARFEALSAEPRVLAREAYLSVLALGQLLVRAREDELAPPRAIDRVSDAVAHLLDLFTPYVSRADDALRRVLLENASLETALAGVPRGP